MAVNTHKLSLDTDKSCKIRTLQKVKIRQGDKAADIIEAAITSNLVPRDMAGLTARVMVELENGSLATATCSSVSGQTGVVRATLDASFSSCAGKAKSAYIEIKQGTTVVASTENFIFEVLPGADVSAEAAKPYVSLLDQVTKRAEELADELQSNIDDANISMDVERLDPGLDPTVTESGAGLQKTFTLGIPSATAGVSCEAGPADVVTVHGAAEDAPVVQATVYGETRQNLWVNPRGTNVGVTLSPNADGSITASGTATNVCTISADIYTLKAGGTYTLSIDNLLPGASTATTFRLRALGSDGVNTLVCELAAKPSVTFTAPSVDGRIVCEIRVANGATVSGTYRIMLNEGPEAAPWCPPGLASVENTKVESFGKNLIRGDSVWSLSDSVSYNEKTGVFTVTKGNSGDWSNCNPKLFLKKGTYKISGSIFGNGHIVQIGNRSGVIEFTQGDSGQISIPRIVEIQKDDVYIFKIYTYADTYPFYGTLQLEIGEETTDYELPFYSDCVIPLPAAHPYLAGLPDGTCDELDLFWDGTARLVARVGKETYDGSNDENWMFANSYEGYCYYYCANNNLKNCRFQGKGIGDAETLLCDRLNPVTVVWDSYTNPRTGCYAGVSSDSTVRVRLPLSLIQDLNSLKSWLAANPVSYVYPLRSDEVYYYDGSTWSTSRPAIGTMPELRSAGDQTHVWANTSPVQAEVSAHVLLEGGKALGMEHDFTRRVCTALATVASS